MDSVLVSSLLPSSAEVCVVLRNRGREAYLPEKYGSKISIVRTLKVDGTGSYKLQGVSGVVPSKNKCYMYIGLSMGNTHWSRLQCIYIVAI